MPEGNMDFSGKTKHIRVLGRTKGNEFPLVLFWTGSGVEFNYKGTELWCDFESDYSDYEQWIAVYVNEALLSRQMLQKGRQRVCLFRNLQTPKVNRVKVIKEVQAMPGDEQAYLAIHGLQGDGEFCELQEPACRIEFIGDSITSGEGSYGSVTEQDWIAMWFSASRSYPYFVAQQMDAEYRVISQSGYGVYCAYDNNLEHAIPRYYEQVCGVLSGERNEAAGAKELYDFSLWQPDYIVINLGTNDGGAFHNPEWYDEETGRRNKMYRTPDGLPAKECLEKVRQAVTDFLMLVRKHNKNAQILWAYGMMGTVVESAIKEGIEKYRSESGDKKVHYLALDEITGEQIGARSHPGLNGHRATAEKICEKLCELKGKEEN